MKIEFKNCTECCEFYTHINSRCLICTEAVYKFFGVVGSMDLTIALHPFKGSKKFVVKDEGYYNYRWTHKTEPNWQYLTIKFGNAVRALEPKDITQSTTIYVRCTAAQQGEMV